MASDAHAGIGARFFRMTREKPCAVEARKVHVVERELGRERRYGALPVARCALAFGVASRAEVAGARRPRSVLSQPVAVVHHVIVGRLALRGQIDMAAVTVSQCPLVPVPMAPEAEGHLGQDGVGAGLGDLDVTAHAVAMRLGHVPGVLEAQLRARELDGFAHVGLGVAPEAGPVVVRLFVAAPADRLIRDVERAPFDRGLNARVALDAVDSVKHVSPVLEGMAGRARSQAQDPGAGRRKDRERRQRVEAGSHGSPELGVRPGVVVTSKTRDRRTSPSASYR